jgi:uncharacterized protein (TIGR02246 family)
MRRVIAGYTVKPGQDEVNEKPVRVVYDELHQTQLTGLRYATFRPDDGRTPADRRGGPDRQLPPARQLNQKGNTMTASNTTTAGTSQDSAIRAVFARTSRAWANGDGEAFAAWYAPDATVILPGVYLPGQDAIREAMAAAFAGPQRCAAAPAQAAPRTPRAQVLVHGRHSGHTFSEPELSRDRNSSSPGPASRMLETEGSRTFAAVDHAQHTNRRGCSVRQPISISATARDVKNRRSARHQRQWPQG